MKSGSATVLVALSAIVVGMYLIGLGLFMFAGWSIPYAPLIGR